MRSPCEPLNPLLAHELARLNERDELKALDELSIHSTLVLFDPGHTTSMTKRRSSAGKAQHKFAAPPGEVPFGRRQFSKKKKIRPVWKSVFNKNKSPKQETHKTGLISFFKSLGGSNKHSLEPASAGKSKIARSIASDDKQSGYVTRFAAPPSSPKHTKQPKKQDLTTPTNEAMETDPFSLAPGAECRCGECRECYFRDSGCPRPGAALVARNESYRAMKPLRTQSVPVEYQPTPPASKTSLHSESETSITRPSRSRSFRDKLGFLPDKSKQSK